MKPYIYTETAFIHEGDFDYLKSLIDLSAGAGIQGIKFQVLLSPGEIMSSKHPSFLRLKSWTFSKKQWNDLFKYTRNKGLDIIFMPLDSHAVELSQNDNIKYVELHSISFYDQTLLEQIRVLSIPLILGVGGRTLEEIIRKEELFGSQLEVLMVGFQAFPSELQDIKLARIPALKKEFPDLQIGYADHSAYNNEYGILSLEYACLLGATVFEKHITLKEGETRTDYESAVGGSKLSLIKKRLYYLETVLNNYDNPYHMSAAEKRYRNRQKYVVASKNLGKNTILKPENIKLKMVNVESGISNPEKILGKQLLADIEKDAPILINMLK